MKKFSKLLCVLLMLALLCTSIVFAVSAASGDTVEQTVDAKLMANAALGDATGNKLTENANWVNYKQKTDPNGNGNYSDDGVETDNTMLDAFVVTPNGSEDAYVVFTAGENQNGGSFQNVQHTYTYQGEELTSDSYYVVDLDIATPTTAITSIAISLPNRNVNPEDNSGWSGFPFGKNVEITKYVDLDSKWIHFSVVNAMKTNEQYIFVNGEFVCKTGNKAYDDTQVTEGMVLKANGIKLEVAYLANANNPHMIFANESIAFDNVARRDIVDADGIAALDAIISQANPNLKNWAGYPTNVRTGSLPNYVSIDGERYNNLDEAAAALVGNTAKEVKLLNSLPAALIVNCDATIDMNGFTGSIRGATADVKVSTNGDIVTVDAPFQPSMIETNVSDANLIKAATSVGTSDNILSRFTFINMNGISADGKTPGIYTYLNTVPATGDEFLTYIGNSQVNQSSNTFSEVQIMKDITYNSGAAQFIIYDFDVALLSNETFAFMVIPRDGGGSGMWGGSTPTVNAIATAGLGEFQHITVVFDIANNDAYYYNNNTLVLAKTENGWTSEANFANFKTAAKWNFNGIRFGSNTTGAIAVDNIYARHLTGADADALKGAITNQNLTLWGANVYGDDYTLPKFGAAVSIDGVEYTSATTASVALTGNDVKNVEILRAFSDTLNVSCNAVIETNGFNVNITYTEGSTYKKEGTVITIKVPYQSSAEFEYQEVADPSAAEPLLKTPANITAAVKGSFAGNLLNNYGVAKTKDFEHYVVSPAGSTDSFAAITPVRDGKYTQDIQFTGNCTEVHMTNGTSYYVIDIDLASDTQIGKYMYICPVLRFADGAGGTPFGYSVPIAEYIEADGQWHHLTLVGDMADNTLYVFVDGKIEGTYAQAYNDYADFSGNTGLANNLKFQSVKISNNSAPDTPEYSTDDVLYVNNAGARVYADNATAGDIEAAIAASTLAGWSNNVAGNAGANLPAVATVDGVDYYCVADVEAALAGSADKTVDICRDNLGTIVVEGNAVIDTHGFDATLTTVSKVSYIDAFGYPATLVGPYAVTVDEDIVTFTEVTEDNLYEFSAQIDWTHDGADFADYETVYYAFGQKIEYASAEATDYSKAATYGNYVNTEGKLLTFAGWELCDENLETIDAFPVAGPDFTYGAAYGTFTSTDSFSVVIDFMYNYTLHTNYTLNVFVPAASVAEGEGVEVNVNGETYYAFSSATNAPMWNDIAECDVVVNIGGTVYCVTVSAKISNYAYDILSGNYSDEMKTLIYAAIDYANASYNQVNMADVEAFASIVHEFSAYATENKAEYEAGDQEALSAVVKGARFIVMGSPCYRFTRAFTGDVTITYQGIDGFVTKTFSGDSDIILDGIKAYDLTATITIEGNGVKGEYSLDNYIAGIMAGGEDVTYVEAMYRYAVAANAYKLACNVVAG